MNGEDEGKLKEDDDEDGEDDEDEETQDTKMNSRRNDVDLKGTRSNNGNDELLTWKHLLEKLERIGGETGNGEDREEGKGDEGEVEEEEEEDDDDDDDDDDGDDQYLRNDGKSVYRKRRRANKNNDTVSATATATDVVGKDKVVESLLPSKAREMLQRLRQRESERHAPRSLVAQNDAKRKKTSTSTAVEAQNLELAESRLAGSEPDPKSTLSPKSKDTSCSITGSTTDRLYMCAEKTEAGVAMEPGRKIRSIQSQSGQKHDQSRTLARTLRLSYMRPHMEAHTDPDCVVSDHDHYASHANPQYLSVPTKLFMDDFIPLTTVDLETSGADDDDNDNADDNANDNDVSGFVDKSSLRNSDRHKHISGMSNCHGVQGADNLAEEKNFPQDVDVFEHVQSIEPFKRILVQTPMTSKFAEKTLENDLPRLFRAIRRPELSGKTMKLFRDSISFLLPKSALVHLSPKDFRDWAMTRFTGYLLRIISEEYYYLVSGGGANKLKTDETNKTNKTDETNFIF